MKIKIALVPFLLVIAASAWAQMGSKPGPEVKKLDYFVGTWTVKGPSLRGLGEPVGNLLLLRQTNGCPGISSS